MRRKLDLGGRKILYVGGRSGLVRHFRVRVEQVNARFIHHDGGTEEDKGRLERVSCQGDAILCPVDCMSHHACLRAKRFCKQKARTFVPLRSSRLSSFVRGLWEIASQASAPSKGATGMAQ
jgi:hypothetical protein